MGTFHVRDRNIGFNSLDFSNVDVEHQKFSNFDMLHEIHRRIGINKMKHERHRPTLTLLYWNGGGCMSSRLCVNPVLKSLILAETPDVFVYAESMVYSNVKLTSPPNSLSDYDSVHHIALKNSNRRGISIFYLQKHRYILSKDLASKNYDIIWVKLESTHEKMVFCFFYAPGEHRSKKECIGFYDELREGYAKYSQNYKVFFMGDSNARLGFYSQDKCINGRFVSNNNKPMFLGFLEYTDLYYLNGIYAKGQPTYEIINRKKSIIDVGLTNHLPSVHNFQVLPNILGVNPQTCDKVLKLTVNFSDNVITSTRKGNYSNIGCSKFRFCNDFSLLKVRDWVSERINELVSLRPDDTSIYKYSVLIRMYEFAKTRFLGYATKRHSKQQSSPKLNKLQLLVRYLTTQYKHEPSKINLMKLRLAHTQLTETWKMVRQENFSRWLAKLNKLNHQQATRSFFSELKKRNRNPEVFGPIENSKGLLSKTLPECLKNWSDFYSDLYKGNNCHVKFDFRAFPHFQKITPAKLKVLNEDITISEVASATYTFKTYCSPGADMILNRDLTCLFIPNEEDSIRWEILRFIHKLFLNFWEQETVPENFKQSIIRPFLKPGKNPCKRGNYRPISLLNVPLKLYEQIIKNRLLGYLEDSCFFSDAQAAYRKNRSTSDNLLVVQEIFYYYRYTKKGPRGATGKQPLFLVFMDLRKAFDSVPREYLFAKLAYIGVTGKLFNVLKDIYTRNKARVKIGNRFSAYFEINSGVMQGSKLGPILFIFYINDLLRKLNDSQQGARLGDTVVSALGFADDIVLIADCPNKLQGLLDICNDWCRRNGMAFNNDKCTVLPLNTPAKNVNFKLGESHLKKVKIYKYLGVVFSNIRLTSLYTRHFKSVIEKAEKRINCVRHFGFHSDGLRPATSIGMYKVLVRPILEYASQVLSYRHYYFTSPRKPRTVFEPTDFLLKLEQLQNRTLKLLIPCPRSTPCCLLRLLTGTISLVAHIDILKLRYFWNLTHSEIKSFAHEIYKYKRTNFLESNIGYVHEIFNLCCEYNMMWVWHGTTTLKINPLTQIKNQIVQLHLKRDIQIAAGHDCIYSSLYLSSGQKTGKYKLNKLLRSMGFFQSTQHRRFFLYSFLDTSAYSRPCPKCSSLINDVLTHALTKCPNTHTRQLRVTLRLKLLLYNAENASLSCKKQLFSQAIHSPLIRRALCDFLVSFGIYTASE